MIDADLEHGHGAASETLEMPVVNVEVVNPLVDESSRVALEVFPQGIGRAFLGHGLKSEGNRDHPDRSRALAPEVGGAALARRG